MRGCVSLALTLAGVATGYPIPNQGEKMKRNWRLYFSILRDFISFSFKTDSLDASCLIIGLEFYLSDRDRKEMADYLITMRKYRNNEEV
jgi:hypothetical protein